MDAPHPLRDHGARGEIGDVDEQHQASLGRRDAADAAGLPRQPELAAEAERGSIKYKQVEYMQAQVGNNFECIISGVTEWGIYVEEPETKAEGMVHVKDIPNDFYFFEEKNYRLVGKTHGKSYRLGDKLKVKINTVDLKKKLIGMKLQ